MSTEPHGATDDSKRSFPVYEVGCRRIPSQSTCGKRRCNEMVLGKKTIEVNGINGKPFAVGSANLKISSSCA